MVLFARAPSVHGHAKVQASCLAVLRTLQIEDLAQQLAQRATGARPYRSCTLACHARAPCHAPKGQEGEPVLLPLQI